MDYAETTMNELLGWYGYEKVDSRDTQGLNLTHFASKNNSNAAADNNNSTNGISPPSSAMEGSDASEDVASHHGGLESAPSRLRPDSVSPCPDGSSDEVARQQQQMVSALSSIVKHPDTPDSPNLPPGCIVCAWCQKVGMKLFTLKTPNGCKAFCSELCFTQCRRASFKKNKICDWCKHVRHTVNYVDFQDGEQQLQFCGDKCLNQYKMNIFCKETQAHLQMHTHLKEAACKMASTGSVNLITPELWLRDCKTNGNSRSPHETIDIMEDINSDDNISAAPSPSLILESPKPSTPPIKEKKEHKQEQNQAPKEKVLNKSSSKHSPRKNVSEKVHHQSKHHRERKVNGLHNTGESPGNPRQSPIHASPPSHTRSNQITNGSHSLLSPPPLGSVPRPPPYVGPLPPRPCPPVPSPLNMGNIDHGRQPFFQHNVVPPPFQFLAQQQMEAFLRSQHGLDLRSKPPPPLPIPPWVMPPFPQVHVPPPPHIPPSLNSRSPSLSHSSSPVRSHNQSSSHKSNHHGKHKGHSKHTSTFANNVETHAANNTTSSEISVPPSLLPPVTVMVPFPLILPVPLPIPVPIPIPPEVMEKYGKLKAEKKNSVQNAVKNSHNNKDVDSRSHRKRKHSHESSKHKRKRRESTNDNTSAKTSCKEGNVGILEVNPMERFYNPLESSSYRISDNTSVDLSRPPNTQNLDLEVDSRSYSPLSEAISSNEEEIERTLKNGDKDAFSNVNFSSYNLGLMRSSPSVATRAADHNMGLHNTLENCKSPSPTNLSVREKERSNVSSSPFNFKKKHLRDQMSIVT
ncbi:sine oculis-binding protein homolog A-like isoform X2 [Stegodyphus dumicola]|uniref:sine oculis-binding protein homolog A-like isoform X2 n=1 Tax=Stegodyphus dumicola TaxID=202533 RepID=UPI0015B32FC6|nr:sine oculis-binding protein homolog A-like isoform X2 [Stegodyphus dumicola]